MDNLTISDIQVLNQLIKDKFVSICVPGMKQCYYPYCEKLINVQNKILSIKDNQLNDLLNWSKKGDNYEKKKF